jgi:putative transposase
MEYNFQQHHRHSIRLQGYDYSEPGAYFVTICTEGHKCLFGDIVEQEMRLNRYGQTMGGCWAWLGQQYPYIELDKSVIMPNHMHGIIIVLDDSDCRGGSQTAPTMDHHKYKPLGRLIGAFKTVSTKQINQIWNTPGLPLWQRNYYEHIVRNEEDLAEIRRYIINNPLKWDLDRENPYNKKGKRP